MRVLVIGGTGFIGGHAVSRLVKAGHIVAVFHRGSTPGEAEVLSNLGGRRRLAEFTDAFRRFDPQVVLDTIAFLEREAQELVRIFVDIAERIVVLSSQDVYRAFGRFRGTEPGPPELVPYAEDAPLREQLHPYRGSATSSEDELLYFYEKILVEQAVASAPGLSTKILRLPLVYGPGDRYGRVREYLSQMDAGRDTILLDARKAAWRWTRGYVENVAAAIAAAVADPRTAGRTYNLGDEPVLTEADWVRAIGTAAGWMGQVVTVPANQLPADAAEPYDFSQDLVADLSRVRADLSVGAWFLLTRR
jgi:nucleoside-diphosphate-sugar epimerase